MASGLQVKCSTHVISGGYAGEETGFSRGYGDWATVSLSGSVESNYYYRDSDTADNNNSSKIVVTIRDSWSASVNDTNNVMTVTLSSTIVSIQRGWIIGNPVGVIGTREIAVKNDYGGGWIWGPVTDNIGYDHTVATNINLGSRTFTLSPGQSAGRGSVYLKNNTPGHSGDATPSIYVDEFWMGIDIRNILPDKPSAPTFGAVTQAAASCTTVNARMVITPTASSATYPGIEHHARYYVNNAWSGWTSNFPLVMNDLPENTTITVQVYSNQGNLVGPTNTTTFTTWKKPDPATVTLTSQWGSDDETRVDLTFTYTQADFANYGAVTVYGKVKNGDDPWSDWFELGRTQTGTYELESVDQNRVIGFKTYTVGDGLCSVENSYTFRAFEKPDPVTYNTPVLVDTGACYNVSVPWVQTSAVRYSSGDTYISYKINDGRWTRWSQASNWAAGTLTISCVPYDAIVQVRAYSVGNGLRSELSTTTINIPSEVIDDTPYDGPIFINNVLCDNLMYLVELICQEWYALKDGERTKWYANEDTKAACKGDELDPTLHSILSRIYRFFGALDCLICNGLNDSFNHHKRGPAYSVYRSEGDDEYGHWTLPDTVVTEGSTNLAYSYAVKNAIDEFVHSVYHYVGEYQYMVYKPSQLTSLLNVVNGDKAIVKVGADGTNQIYTYNGSTWDAGSLSDFDEFSLVHIDKPSEFTTDYGLDVEIKAGSAWYWYNNNWNNLDAQIDEMVADLDELLNRNHVEKRDANETSIQFAVVQRNADESVTGLPASATKKTIYFVTEDM